MSTKQFPDFDGWTVEKSERPDGKHEFFYLKKHEAGKDGKLTVWSSTGADKDPEAAYLVGKRDALAEDVRVSSPEDLSAATSRFEYAHRRVVAGKVRRRLAKGFDSREEARKYAVDRLSGAGFTLTEIGALLGEDDRRQIDPGSDEDVEATRVQAESNRLRRKEAQEG